MKYDAIIIGSGQAGNPLSYRLADVGWQVALIEKGNVGMTEKEARAAGYKLKIGTIPMSNVARAIERDETRGLMKVIVDAANDQILGAAILGCEGGELVHVLYTLMPGKMPYTLLKGAVYIHPTLTEGFFTLLESVKLVN